MPLQKACKDEVRSLRKCMHEKSLHVLAGQKVTAVLKTEGAPSECQVRECSVISASTQEHAAMRVCAICETRSMRCVRAEICKCPEFMPKVAT